MRGLNYFGHHVNLITVLFVPFYWLGAGPHFLYLVETVVMAAGAIPIWLLAPRPDRTTVDRRSSRPARSCCSRRSSGSTGGTSIPTR